MHFAELFCLNGEDAKDLAQERVWVCLHVFRVSWHHFLDKLEFRSSHCLDNELLIVAEEKEAAGPACAFACLEYHVSVELWT